MWRESTTSLKKIPPTSFDKLRTTEGQAERAPPSLFLFAIILIMEIGENTSRVDYPPITDVIKNHNVFITHSFIEGDYMISQTAHNPWHKRLDILYAFSPTISCSTFRPDRHEEAILRKFGVFINGGEISAAFDSDANSTAVSIGERRSLYDSQSVEKAITTRGVSAYNEIFINNPSIAGIFMNLSTFDLNKPNEGAEDIKELKRKAEEYSLPVYAIYKGKVVLLKNLWELNTAKDIQQEVEPLIKEADAPQKILELKGRDLDSEELKKLRLRLLSENVIDFSEMNEIRPLLLNYSAFLQGRLNYLYHAIFNGKLNISGKYDRFESPKENDIIPSGAEVEILLNLIDPYKGRKTRLISYNGEIYTDQKNFLHNFVTQEPRYSPPTKIKGIPSELNSSNNNLRELMNVWLGRLLEGRIKVGTRSVEFMNSIKEVFNIYQSAGYKKYRDQLNYFIAGLSMQARVCEDRELIDILSQLNLPIDTDAIENIIDEQTGEDGMFDYSVIADTLN